MWVRTYNMDDAVNLDAVDVVYLARGREIVAEMGKDEYVLGKYRDTDEALEALEGLFAAMGAYEMPRPSRKKGSRGIGPGNARP